MFAVLNRKYSRFCAAGLLILWGCASTNAPRDWLPGAAEMQSDAFGAWITLSPKQHSRADRMSGELIAVQPDSVFILVQDSLVAMPRAGIADATLAAYDNHWGSLWGWTALGAVSTLSHGIFLILSAPLWILVGSITAASASHEPIRQYPDRPWEELKKFARFPQGLPVGIDRGALRGK